MDSGCGPGETACPQGDTREEGKRGQVAEGAAAGAAESVHKAGIPARGW